MSVTREVATHTPGPWTAKPENQYVPAQVWADGRQLCEVYGETRDTRQANARLIAAAPELLEVLKRAVPWLGKMIAEGVHNNSVLPRDAEITLQRAEALIAHIEGRE